MAPTRADRIQPRNPNEARVLSFFTLLMAGDLERFAAIWEEDAVQEHPWRFEGLTAALTGRAEIVDDYRRMFAKRRDMVFMINEIHETCDPECFIVEAHGRSVVGETGHVYDQEYVAVFRLRGGRILLNRFYFNPMVTQAAFSGVLIGKGLSKQD